MGNGWIKLHRKLQLKGFYLQSQYVHLWVHLLLSANHTSKEYMTNGTILNIKKGQLLTGRKQLSEGTGIPESTVDRILNLLENEHQIEQQKTTKYRLITIVNWDKYQIVDSTLDNKRTAREQQADTNNKVKKEKKVKNSSTEEDIQLDENYLEDEPEEATNSSREVIHLFKAVNPAWLQLSLRKTEHQSALRLLKIHPFEWWVDFMPKYAVARENDQFVARADKPTQMEQKIGTIELHIKSAIKSKKPNQKIWI